MFQLALAHLTSPDRERDIEADLRQRRILKASDAARSAVNAEAVIAVPAPRHLAAIGRVRTVGR